MPPFLPLYGDLATPICSDVRDESLEHTCWRVSPTSGGKFVQVSASCGISDRHEVECWKDPFAAVPAGRFDFVDDDAIDACAARSEGGVACWGNASWPAVPGAPKFIALSVGGSTLAETEGHVTACGLMIDHDVICWGNGKPGWSGQLFLPGPFATVELGSGMVVGLTTDGFLLAFSGKERVKLERSVGDRSEPIQGRFKAFSEGGFDCQIDVKGEIECDGFLPAGVSREPPEDLGEVAQIRSGSWHACALEKDGDVRCWGDFRPPPNLKFRYISRPDTWDSYCGITIDDQTYCWGDPSRNPQAKQDERIRELERRLEQSR